MKTKIYILSILFILPLITFSQSHYYYYQNEKIFINLDRDYLSVNSTNNNTLFLNNHSTDYISQSELSESNERKYLIPTDEQLLSKVDVKKYYIEIELKDGIKNSILNYINFMNFLSNSSDVIKVSPNFKTLSGKRLGLTNDFYVKLKNVNDESLLYNYAENLNLEIIGKDPYMELWYVVSCTKDNPKNALEYANQFYESGLFNTAEPAFTYHDLLASNDPFYPNQWGLNNTGQYDSAYAGIDINIEEAWTISTGNSVKVAIYDHGFEMDHPDLSANVLGGGFDATTGSPTSQVRGPHGTPVAGIIGAVQNSIGVVGVAPDSNIFSISIKLVTSDTPSQIASGFNWAWQNEIDIINNSWGGYTPSSIITDAINNALVNGRNGKGTIIVFASGNENNTNIRYPGNAIPDILVVGAINPCGERKTPNSCDEESWGSNYGNQLDIMAPGVLIPTTDRQGNQGYNPNYETNSDYTNSLGYFSSFNGTSAAAPHIAGVAALVLSANQCLSAQQVNDIIESTAQKVGGYSYTNNSNRPNGTWNNEMGYGLVDAYAAVQMAQSMGSTTLDLYVKDSPDDDGIEPNTITQYMWTSQDIWVRNNFDIGLEHQNPEYKSNGEPNYINVRVINKSCVTSIGNETLTLNWAKANTALTWPQNWDGSLTNAGDFPLGGELPFVATIPIIQAGDEVIVRIPWVVPNPDDYSDNPNPWHFCLLSRIDAVDDPLTSPMTSNPNTMVRNNNNLAWKNLTVVDLETERTTAMVMIANPSDAPRTFLLEFQEAANEAGKPIFEEAEVTLKMDGIIFNAWERGGKQTVLLNNKSDEKSKLIKGNNALLNNIMFNANEMGLLTLDFKFLTKELTEKSRFVYHLIQKDATTGEIIGGETFVVKKKPRPIFMADAGDDKEIDENETITISAEQINESAIYNWYDTEGNLIYQGKDLTVSANITKKYKLEIIADIDGFKDYDEIEVKLKPSVIETISPNPTSNEIQISYKLNGVNSAYLMIVGQYGTNGTSNNYVLDVNSSEATISMANYTNGFYTVALVCDGQIVDAKTLIKQ